MKFSCEKALLVSAVATTSRAVAAKSSIPAMEGILIEADTRLRLTGYDLEKGIQATVPAEIQEPGSLVLSARLFGEIIRKMPDDVVVFTAQNYMVNIKCGLSEFNILGTDPEEFPELPTVDQQNSLTLEQSVLRSMISQTLFAVSDNESRPIHTGSLFEADDKGLTIVSVDGYRLALRHEAIDKKEGAESFSFVVPGAALSEVEKICSDVDEPAQIIQGARHVMFKVGSTMLVSRRLEGEFLAYRQAIPRNNTIHVVGDTRALLSSIDRVSLIISDKLKSPLRCTFDHNLLKISTKTAIGDAYDECPLEGDGGGLEIGFPYAKAVDAGIDFALTDVSCKYRSMTRFGEEVAVTLTINHLSPAKLELGYRMTETTTGELKAEGTSGHFFYDRAKGRPVALKRALPEVYGILQSLL